MARARAWCFTLYKGQDPELGGAERYENLVCRYLIVGDEICPDTGRAHHQGYVSFVNPLRMQTVIDRLPGQASVRRANGTALQNRTYCSKEGKVIVESGDIPKPGRRTDLEDVREAVNAGCSMREICDTANSFQAIRGAEILLKYKEEPRDWLPVVKWFWGGTGTGKTRTAFEELPDAWVSAKNLKWWDGYDGHESVIIDDFRGDFCTYHELLRILDRYPYRVECKGGSRQLRARTIIITAPFRPELAYATLEDKGQLLRRISEIRCFD